MVTICHCCPSDRHQPYHRNQSSNKPQPPHEEIRPFPGLAKNEDGDGCQQHNRAQKFPRRHTRTRERIIHGQVARPQSLEKIFCVGNDRVSQA